MNIAICDDNKTDIEYLTQLLSQYADLHSCLIQVHSFLSAEDLLKDEFCLNHCCIFLDIFMNDLTGMDCARILRQKGYKGHFIFTTTSKDYVFDSFLVDVSDYLLKPYTFERFSLAMDKILRSFQKVDPSLSVTVQGIQYTVLLKDILYIETDGHSSLLHKDSEILRVNQPISYFESILRSYPCFYRTHRSYLLNMAHVSHLNKGADVTMDNGDQVLLTVRNAASIKKQITHFIWERTQQSP